MWPEPEETTQDGVELWCQKEWDPRAGTRRVELLGEGCPMGAVGFRVRSGKSTATCEEEAADVMPDPLSPPTPSFHCCHHGHK